MKKLFLTLIILTAVISAHTDAEALTIQNKCKFPVAGSVITVQGNVSVAQFRLIPGQTKRMLKGFNKMQLKVRTIPDVYDLEMLKITSTEVDTPDSHIELKQSPQGIKFSVQ
ncbi:hypothetical protein [Maridesulfovibrio salexigens]|uniref:Uncharacterized protein n=1 Tax=Maridesulfovibrio salexigens (strain ATCC 14822 / DSM 2638 / NCIMB 8403 / VKM B-1763) TaxID=526222 RepID=C6C0M4_MARSD|nr:hypothetical protein [Maridesulfovibrio salexigens]ACS79158.1 hypothetical protein Desal_1094 [Maridesulfovibrio salexigens DSM 2638]